MKTLPLRANLNHLKKQAKTLLAATMGGKRNLFEGPVTSVQRPDPQRKGRIK